MNFFQCADANRRISQLSLFTMMELSRGSSGELRLQKRDKSFYEIDGIDFVLQTLVVDDRSLMIISCGQMYHSIT